MNVRFSNESLRTALIRLYAEAWVTGDLAARAALLDMRKEEKALTKANDLDADVSTIDWDSWQPGDTASAMLLDPPQAFQNLVQRSGNLISGLDKTGYEQIGTALADAIRTGMPPRKAAKLIEDAVGSPARALTIAVTENSRVMNAAAIQRYRDAGIQQVKWMAVTAIGGAPCEKCAQNIGQVVELGASFNSGQIQPPAHPHCRCNLLPEIPDYEALLNENGIKDIAPASDLIEEIPSRRFGIGQDEEIHEILTREQGAYVNTLSQKEMKAVAGYQSEGTYEEVNDFLRGKSKRISPANKELIETLDEVIDGASLDFNTTVYRGVSDDTGAFMNLKIGDKITELGYQSTSPNPAVAEAFANSTVVQGRPVVLEIDVPYGQPALASDVSSTRLFGHSLAQDDEMIIEITGFTRLNEITLPRSMTLEVTEIIDKENARYIKVRIDQK
jgi:SPP1 gp7 family putative phage head morphogenesis protein